MHLSTVNPVRYNIKDDSNPAERPLQKISSAVKTAYSVLKPFDKWLKAKSAENAERAEHEAEAETKIADDTDTEGWGTGESWYGYDDDGDWYDGHDWFANEQELADLDDDTLMDGSEAARHSLAREHADRVRKKKSETDDMAAEQLARMALERERGIDTNRHGDLFTGSGDNGRAGKGPVTEYGGRYYVPQQDLDRAKSELLRQVNGNAVERRKILDGQLAEALDEAEPIDFNVYDNYFWGNKWPSF